MAQERSRSRPPPKSSVTMLLPGLIAVVLIGGAIAVGVLNRKEPPPAQETSAAERPKPFADLPPDVPPNRRGKDWEPPKLTAPSGLAATPVWVEAQAIAAEAEQLFEATREAKLAGDHALANEKGREARKRFNQAAEMTAEWEEELFETYGENEPTVREIKRTRSRWFERLDWLLKSIAR